MLNRIDGYKTYIVATLAIAWAVGGMVAGLLPASEAINVILAAMGAAGLRHAI